MVWWCYESNLPLKSFIVTEYDNDCVSTALILFGDKIVEIFTGKIPLAERAMNSYIKAIKEGNSEFSTATKTFLSYLL